MLIDICRSPWSLVFVEGIRLPYTIVELCNWLCVHDKRGSWWDSDEKLPQSRLLCFWMGLIRIAAKTLRARREGLFHFPVVFCHPHIVFPNYFRAQKICSKDWVNVCGEVSL